MASKFQNKKINEYNKKGYTVIKTIRLNINGYPDLFLLKQGLTYFREVKEGNDKLSELQKLRIDQLIENGFDACAIHETKGVIYPLNYIDEL